MNIYDPDVLKRLVNEYLANKLITVKPSQKYPNWSVVKYTRRVFFDNLWDEFLCECRGLVIDENYNIIVQPLTKIFNYGEQGRFLDVNKTERILCSRKYNGFMLAVTNSSKYGLIFSTTGSLDSDFCKLGEHYYRLYEQREEYTLELDSTAIFEVCAQEDPHIIKEESGVYYLGTRDGNGVWHPNWDNTEEKSLTEIFSESIKHEGYVCYLLDGQAFKIKSPFYLKTKFFARASNLEKAISKAKSSANEFYSLFDEDFYDIVDFVRMYCDIMINMNEQERIEFLNLNYFSNEDSRA